MAPQTDGAPQAPAAGNVSGKPRGLALCGLGEQCREPIYALKAETAPRMGSSITQVNFDHRERIEALVFQLGDHLVVGSDFGKVYADLTKSQLRA